MITCFSMYLMTLAPRPYEFLEDKKVNLKSHTCTRGNHHDELVFSAGAFAFFQALTAILPT